jgi:hypothetical protein
MRYLLCLIVGLLAGAIIAGSAGQALSRRHAWPRAVMTVMQHELGTARSAAHAGPCSEPAMTKSAAHLRLLTTDLEAALLAPGDKDRVLSQYASEMRAAVAKWDTGVSCDRQSQALTEISNACDACHRDYR